MTIRVKVFLALGMLLISSVGVITYGIYGSQLISKSSNEIEQKIFPVMEKSLKLSALVKETNVIVTDAYVEKEGLYLDELPGKQKIFRDLVSSSEIPDEDLEELVVLYDSYVEHSNKYLKVYVDSNEEGLGEVDQELERVHLIAKQLALGITRYKKNRSDELSDAMQGIRAQSQRFNFILVVSGAVLLGVIATLIIILSGLIRSIRDVVNYANKLAEGDLDEPINHEGTDEVAVLRWSFEVMRLSLKDMIENLDNKVSHRTFELSEAKKEMSDILNSVKEGLFTFNCDMKIYTEHSKIAEQHFMEAQFSDAKIEQLFRLDDRNYKRFCDWVGMCFANKSILKQWDKYRRLSPVKEFLIDTQGHKRIIEISFQPILEVSKLKRIMVLSRDITLQREAEDALVSSHLEQRMIVDRVTGLVGNDVDDLIDLFNLSEHTLSGLRLILDTLGLRDQIHDAFRVVHTLKGHWGTLGFESITRLLGELEGCLAQVRDGINIQFSVWLELLDAVAFEFKALNHLKEKIYSAEQTQSISIDKSRYHALLNSIYENTPFTQASLYESVYYLNSLPINACVKKYQHFIERSQSDLKKEIATLDVKDNDFLIHREVFAGLDDVILHLVRNAVDHGIETIEVREALGKGPGHISIEYQLINGCHNIVVADDGAGVDPEVIAEKALQAGLVDQDTLKQLTAQQRTELIFEAGFSARDNVTELSGRGVGMDVVKNKLKQMNGFVELSSEIGKGTKITLSYPANPIKHNPHDSSYPE